MKNLSIAFPEKTDREITFIIKGFYHHLADLLIESLKGFSLSESEIIERYRAENAEVMNTFYRQGKSIICVAGHYANWEWTGSASGQQFLHKPVGFYKPLSNRYIDRYIQRSRIKGRSLLASISKTSESFRHDWGEPAAYYMVADQSPPSPKLAYWVDFFSLSTATLHGPEKYARLYNLPIVFVWVRKIKRGYYTIHLECLEEFPDQTKPGNITARFMKSLEMQIREDPRYYLWSHRRWKLTQPETATHTS